ncbi:MAG: tetratricopeptide repeat protein, partial [Myxococcota bacterium]
VASEGEDLERARVLAEQAVEELPEGPDELHTLGYVYLRSGQYELAAMRLQEAVARASAARKENALYHYHLALALRQVHRNESAAQAFERALELDPALPQAVHARAERKAALLGDPAPADPFEGG